MTKDTTERRRTGGPARRRALTLAATALIAAAACGPNHIGVYEDFEAELIEELASEWGATPTAGCPAVERWTMPNLYRVPYPERNALHEYLGIAGEPGRREGFDTSTPEYAEYAAKFEEMEAAWMRSIPTRHCWCLQHTIADIRYRLAVLQPGRFEGVDPATLLPQSQNPRFEEQNLVLGPPDTHEEWIERATTQPYDESADLTSWPGSYITKGLHNRPGAAERAVRNWKDARYGTGEYDIGWQNAARMGPLWHIEYNGISNNSIEFFRRCSEAGPTVDKPLGATARIPARR